MIISAKSFINTIAYRTVLYAFVIVSVSVSACGGGGGGGASNPGSGSTSTAADTVRAMETSGQLPTLDRTSTLSGIDADSNGVRDDLDTYIAATQDPAPRMRALAQMARAINSTMIVDVANDASLGAAATELRDAVNCIWSRYDPPLARTKVEEIRKLMVNTRQRYDAYGRYNQARNGAVIGIPTGDTCQ